MTTLVISVDSQHAYAINTSTCDKGLELVSLFCLCIIKAPQNVTVENTYRKDDGAKGL
jgi:hypothetical protein